MKKLFLIDGVVGYEYTIISVDIKDKSLKQHLVNLGIEKNAEIKVLKYNYFRSGILVKVLDVNYAIDKFVASRIVVYG